MRIDPAFRTAACISHGGNLGEAVRRYRIQRGQWIDLSTGINPYGFPIPTIDPAMWLRLPDDDDGLEALAARHYRANHALAVAGTQAAIRLLPALLSKGPVGIGLLTYGEYARAFTQAGFPVEYFVTQSLTAYGYRAPFTLSAHAPLPGHLKHLIVVNPNNPTADLFDTDALLDGRRQLLVRGGTLIVDEAFIDATPQYSIAPASAAGHLIVLRSVGKFFGLAGARVGFVLSDRACIDAMRRLRGPWPLSGPARALAKAALLDSAWQRSARDQLDASNGRLSALLSANGLAAHRTPLFAWASNARAAEVHDRLARNAVRVRCFVIVPSLRFGLPADETAWTKLASALSKSVICGTLHPFKQRLTTDHMETLLKTAIANAKMQQPFGSPCIDVCRLNPQTGYCEGCFRTLEEIRSWKTMTDSDKRGLFEALLARSAAGHRGKPR